MLTDIRIIFVEKLRQLGCPDSIVEQCNEAFRKDLGALDEDLESFICWFAKHYIPPIPDKSTKENEFLTNETTSSACHNWLRAIREGQVSLMEGSSSDSKLLLAALYGLNIECNDAKSQISNSGAIVEQVQKQLSALKQFSIPQIPKIVEGTSTKFENEMEHNLKEVYAELDCMRNNIRRQDYCIRSNENQRAVNVRETKPHNDAIAKETSRMSAATWIAATKCETVHLEVLLRQQRVQRLKFELQKQLDYKRKVANSAEKVSASLKHVQEIQTVIDERYRALERFITTLEVQKQDLSHILTNKLDDSSVDQIHEYNTSQRDTITHKSRTLMGSGICLSPTTTQAVDKTCLSQAVDKKPLSQAVDKSPLSQAVDKIYLPQAVDKRPPPQAVDKRPPSQAVEHEPFPNDSFLERTRASLRSTSGRIEDVLAGVRKVTDSELYPLLASSTR